MNEEAREPKIMILMLKNFDLNLYVKKSDK